MKEIGQGSWATVFLAIHQQTREKYAIKVIDFHALNSRVTVETLTQTIRSEIDLLQSMSHKHVVSLVEALEDSISGKIYLVMQYCERGALLSNHFWRMNEDSVLSSPGADNRCLSVSETRRYIRQIASAIDYCRIILTQCTMRSYLYT